MFNFLMVILMKTFLRQSLKFCVGAFLAFNMMNVANAGAAPANKCKKAVQEHCTKDLCHKYCAAAKIKDCNCNALNGLCKIGVVGSEDELNGVITAQFEACKAGESKAKWEAVTTDEWTTLMPKKSIANAHEDVLPGELRVGEATKIAEKLIHEECIKVHAPKYCKAKQIDDCNPTALCKTLPKELKAQVDAQLMACIAAKRDPLGRKTGRPTYGCPSDNQDPKTGKVLDKTVPWCAITSPSWREEILYPDPEKSAKKQRYTDALADLNKQIDEAKKAKADHNDLDQQLKDLVLEKSLGQEVEEKNEADICGGSKTAKQCRGDTATPN